MQAVFRAKAHFIDGVVHPPVATMANAVYVVLLGIVMVVAQLWRWLAVIIHDGCSGVHFLHGWVLVPFLHVMAEGVFLLSNVAVLL